ncbi:MAG: dihydroorotate dehydrogenase [Phycisphaerales bacterium]|nr:dihydroorotate dehydrogenase [Planctomycetota bacterium]MCH8507259.1 dihydroorotate dehydrogenase [Phycisphaerales bacterium]
MPPPMPESLRTELCGVPLRTPVLLAAGTAGTLDETAEILDLSRIGGVVTKSITRQARDGNPEPRITWTRAGMLNAIGLANPGVDAFAEQVAPRAGAMPCPVIGSIAGFSIEDYVAVAGAMEAAEGIPIAELNVSCPNVHGGVEFGADLGALSELVRAVRPVLASTKLLVKLSPITVGTPHTPADLARVAADSGADGLTLCNTIPAMGIDVRTRRPLLANVTGGLSGPAVHPVVVKIVHDVHRRFAREAGLPIVAAGGVTRWQDAAEFILAGASAVQVGAGTFADPKAAEKIARGLAKWVRDQGHTAVVDLVGAVAIDG